ncbi:helix-turn-helix domain-containing protein [Stenotrophomonas maltophilia]|uniref:helix-turn-helix domain-containing protein n=1 Tax=Stenotrophomonas maltophilia TaxID=40324 RepID=UPI00115D8A52
MHTMQIMQAVKHPVTADLVGRARRKLGLKQGQFAIRLGKSQGVVSRYEKGEVEPPGEVMMHCMHILASVSESAASTATGSQATEVPTSPQALDQLVQTLEGALSLARSMRDKSAGLIQGDEK